ncbi:MAG TPA: alpha-L-fucosidase [Terriglobia bacterium]|nr:alpha-L-fucosidase [Terriglobia bacterium]
MRFRRFVRLGTLVILAVVTAAAQTARETPDQFAQRTQWWREARFGMFIHWGLYAVPADSTDLTGKKGIAEWYFYNKQKQVKDYEKFAAQFNPVKFDAKVWVETAKNAGMKYIVITSKHHDGFDMFDTKLSNYCITKATPFKRDPMKELAAECQRQGIKLCFYHSIMDWHNPDYLPRRPWEKETRPPDGANLDRYIEYMKGQLRELLTNYGPIGIIWFDGGWEHNALELHSQEVNSMIRSLQPGIIINDRNNLPEDYATPEQNIPPNALPGGRQWETCMTMNDTWGYAKNDTNWKSSEDLIRKLIDISSKGGNFLLNVGPTAEGVFPDAINERLAQIGAWMKVNSESIYGTSKSPFRKLPFDGRVTAKGNTLYLHVFEWPKDGLTLNDLETPVENARAIDGSEKLAIKTSPSNGSTVLHISRPKKIDAVATVVELHLAGPPKVSESNLAVNAVDGGIYELKAGDAEIHGGHAQYDWEGVHQEDYIGSWTEAGDYVTWRVAVATGGRFRVEVAYASPPPNEGAKFTVGFEGGSNASGIVRGTKTNRDFRTETLGEIEIPAGMQTLAVRITSLPGSAAMNLHQVRLVPVH